MRFCIGHPYCGATIPEDDIACRKCWFKMPSRIRNEAKAVKRRFPGTKRCEQVLRQFEKLLHDRLEVTRRYNAKVEENKRKYTVVG